MTTSPTTPPSSSRTPTTPTTTTSSIEVDLALATLLPESSRYRLGSLIAQGGMGSVYIGLQRGAGGFQRPVAIKRAHAELLQDQQIRETILKEAHHASCVRHPHVVSVDDVEEVAGELLLVMDYVEGASLSQLFGFGKIPTPIALRIILDAAAGLGAIHEATDRQGKSLHLVHRDVSPQNILVSIDGLSQLTDFGIAKTIEDTGSTQPGTRKGKLGYMAPEYLSDLVSTKHSDLFALGVVLWELLTGIRLFKEATEFRTMQKILNSEILAPSVVDPEGSTAALDAVVLRALSKDPFARYQSMTEFADALEQACGHEVAPRMEVAALVRNVAGNKLESRRRKVQRLRSGGPSKHVTASAVPIVSQAAARKATTWRPSPRATFISTTTTSSPAGDAASKATTRPPKRGGTPKANLGEQLKGDAALPLPIVDANRSDEELAEAFAAAVSATPLGVDAEDNGAIDHDHDHDAVSNHLFPAYRLPDLSVAMMMSGAHKAASAPPPAPPASIAPPTATATATTAPPPARPASSAATVASVAPLMAEPAAAVTAGAAPAPTSVATASPVTLPSMTPPSSGASIHPPQQPPTPVVIIDKPAPISERSVPMKRVAVAMAIAITVTFALAFLFFFLVFRTHP